MTITRSGLVIKSMHGQQQMMVNTFCSRTIIAHQPTRTPAATTNKQKEANNTAPSAATQHSGGQGVKE